MGTLMDFSNIRKSFARSLVWLAEYQKQFSKPPDGAQRVAIKSASLAFACTRLQGRVKKRHVDIVDTWAKEQLLCSESSSIVKRRFRKAIKTTARFFNRLCDFDSAALCSQIAAVLPVSERYAVIDLCIRVSIVNHTLSHQQVTLLRTCSKWLGLDSDRFRMMVEKFLPIDASDGDIELLLGIDSDMSNEQIQDLLTEEFRKWNSRITNKNPAIRKRADKMIQIITTQRIAYNL